MEENIKNEKNKASLLLKISICFALLLIVFFTLTINSNVVLAANESQVCYLSDIDYIEKESRPGWGTILKDQSGAGSKISVKVEGAYYTFDKGMWAHATSTLVYNISAYKNDYDYFTTYMGLNATAASSSNGVKFYVYTSQDGKAWDLKTEENAPITKPGADARYVQISIKDVNYLKLVADSNGSNGNDHSVYADAKFVKQSYLDEQSKLVISLDTYDQKIKDYPNKDLSDPNYELLLLQRKFASCLGEYALQRFINENPENKETIDWLMNDVENLRYYVLGGTPTGGYYSSLNQLTRLLKAYKSDFNIQDPISAEGIKRLHNRKPDAPITKGNLYKRMAITLSLTHSARVALWMQPGAAENQSDAVERYKLYKYMYNEGKFKATDTVDITPWFESYGIEEMRYVMNTLIDDEEVIWLNEYTQSKIDAAPNSAWGLLTPHSYVAYVWPNYQDERFYSEENYDYFNELFAVGDKKLYDYGITRGTSDHKVYKQWMNLRNKFGTGSVCGGISKTGHCIRGVHGIASAVIGQPGHAAIVYYTQDANGNGYWNLDNDVSGWTLSEKGERMPLGWGNASYSRGYSVVYMALAQEAINDMANLEKCQETIMSADAYQGDLVKQEEIYRKALEIQPINIDAWYGLINVYNQSETKTEDQYYDLAAEMAEKLKYFPLPMQHLTNLIKPKLTTIGNQYRFTLLQTRILTEASKTPNNTADQYYVYQPSLTRLEAGYLLGKLDTTIATFSFDGEDANKIVLSDRFNGNGVRWDYCIDGNPTGGLQHWHEVSFDGSEEHKWLLTPEEVASMTAENDLYIHIVGVNYAEENLYKIDIQESQGLPSTLYANDYENKLIAAIPAMMWKLNENDPWTLYKDAEPDLSGDKTVTVKVAATGVYLESKTQSSYDFTTNTDPAERRYISVDHIALNSFSTEAAAQGRHAKNAIDANLNTSWHSNWNGNDPDKFIVFEFDAVKNLTALEYFPAPGGNGKIESAQILVSVDGTDWTEVVSGTDWTYSNTNDVSTKSVDFDPVKAKYVKIVGKRTQHSFITAKMFNLYEDTTAKIVASFSFDGTNAGKIVLDDEVKTSKWKYSIDGGTTWKDGKSSQHQLTDEEINQVNEENKIKIRLNNQEKVYTINIKKMETPATNVYLNDWENRLIGVNDASSLEWKMEGSNQWTSYAEKEPIVKGNKKLFIRAKAAGISAASDIVEYQFTENDTETATYIPISHLSIEAFSSQTVRTNQYEYATNVIDGKISTMWHTNRAVVDPEKYIVIKLDEPKYISKLQYIKQTGYAWGILKNGVISTSMDGENWEEAVTITDLYNPQNKNELVASEDSKDILFGESKKAQYVKLQCTKSCDYVNGSSNNVPYDNFLSAVMLNLYEDTTKAPAKPVAPTAEVEYSTTKLTNQDVTATLVNESTEITVTNNNGSKTHTFKENGEFTFEFTDSKGTKGTATATVNCIDKVNPTATITYNISELTDENVIATLTNASEEITITNNDGNNSYTFDKNGEFTFEFTDKVGNKGTAKANVYWIMTEDQKYEDLKAEIVKIIEDYKAKVTEEEINYKSMNKEEKAKVVEAYRRLKKEDKAPYTTLIDRINKGGKPVITVIQDVYRVKAGTNMNLYDFITIKDNEDGNIVPTSENVKIETNLNTNVPGTYEVTYEVSDSDKNTSTAKMQVVVADMEIPTAEVKYSITELTNQDVTATLTNESEEITIINNNGNRTYTFDKNGTFTFRFVDKAGNEGTAVAKVNWIDKDAPIAMIEYSINSETTEPVKVKLLPNEEVTILNNNGEDTYTFLENGEFTFEFKDKAGNKGAATAKVNWIVEPELPEDYQFESENYTIEKRTISRITPKTTISEFKKNIKTNQELVFTDKDGNTLAEDSILATGMRVRVGGKVLYSIVITGDVNNDGKADFQDILQINKHRLGKGQLGAISLIAGDVNSDGKADFKDILQINKYRLGKVDHL